MKYFKQILPILILVVVLFSAGLITNKIINQRTNQIEIQNLKFKLEETTKELNQWKEQYTTVLKIKNEFRDYTKEIVDLLYLKNIPIGGSYEKTVK